MRTLVYISFFMIIIATSCTKESIEVILPTTGNVILVNKTDKYKNCDFFVVTETYFLSEDYSSMDSFESIAEGEILEERTVINNLNAGVYYIILKKNSDWYINQAKAIQIIAGKTVELNLTD